MIHRSTLLRSAAGLAAALLSASCGTRPAPIPEAQTPLPPGLRGSVVYQRADGIYRTELGSTQSVRIAEGGSWPRWSPDGRRVAFVKGPRIVVVGADGQGAAVVARPAKPRAVAWHPDGRHVLFTDDDVIRSVDLETRETRTVISGWVFRELDISRDSARLVATVRRGGPQMRGFDLARGTDWRIAGGCSASLSPDEEQVTNNDGDHRALSIRQWKNGRKVGAVHAPPGRTFDNQYWSNHPDWIASITDDNSQDVFIHQISQDRAFRVTSCGDADRPDLHLENAD